MERITFTTSCDKNFFPGTLALVKSIRRFYNKDNANIYVLHTDLENESLKLLELYDVTAEKMLDCIDPRKQGKAVATYWALIKQEEKKVLHIDSDAWLLSRIDNVFEKLNENSIIAWNDKMGHGIRHPKKYFKFSPPVDYDKEKYNFNAGIVGYGNGQNIKKLVNDFLNACYDDEINFNCGNQGIIRSLVCKYDLENKINFIKGKDATHYNPIWREAEELEYDENKNRWINMRTGKKQFIFHATGGKDRKIGKNKPWQSPEIWSESVIKCWDWINSYQLEEEK